MSEDPGQHHFTRSRCGTNPLPGEPTASQKATGTLSCIDKAARGYSSTAYPSACHSRLALDCTIPWHNCNIHMTGCWTTTEEIKSLMVLFHSKVNGRKSTMLWSHLISSPDHTASGIFPHTGCRPHVLRQQPASLSCSSRKTHLKRKKCSVGLSPRTDWPRHHTSSCASRRVRTKPANATRDTKRWRGVVQFQNKAASHQGWGPCTLHVVLNNVSRNCTAQDNPACVGLSYPALCSHGELWTRKFLWLLTSFPHF